nr:MAG TPA: hypothetical protein [Caudoviricetes sp.]
MSETKKNSMIPAEKEAEVTKITTKEPETVVYVGPTIAGVASHVTTYNNGLPEGLKIAIEKEPAFRGLVVPLTNLAKAIGDLQTKSGVTHTLYNKVLNYRP